MISDYLKMKLAFLIDSFYSNDVSNTVIDSLNQDGYHVINDFMNTSDIDNLKQDLLNIDPKLLTSYSNDRRIFGAQYVSDNCLDFYNHEILNGFASSYLNCKVNNMSTLYGNLNFDSSSEIITGSGGGWHRDSLGPQFKAILYLSDVSPENGPFQYIPGSHSLSRIRDFSSRISKSFFKTRFSASDINLYCELYNQNITEFTGARGTLILADTRGLHTGKPISKGYRHSLTNYYSPSKLLRPGNNILKLDKITKLAFDSL